MKNNLKKLVILLPVLPMLMANAPAPTPRPSEYEDYTISVSDVQKHSEDVIYYRYTYDIKNTGEGYITDIYANLRRSDNSYDYDNLEGISFDSIFYDSLIIPHQEITAIGKSRLSESSINNYKEVHYNARAYINFADDVTVTGDYELTKVSYANNTYKVNISLEGTKKNDFYYGVIFEITYDEQVRYIHSDEMRGFDIKVAESFDFTKLTNIEVFKVTKTGAYHSNIGEILTGIAIVFFVCFILMISMGIFAAIFFPIMKKKRRARREAALRAKQENASLNNDNK